MGKTTLPNTALKYCFDFVWPKGTCEASLVCTQQLLSASHIKCQGKHVWGLQSLSALVIGDCIPEMLLYTLLMLSLQ